MTSHSLKTLEDDGTFVALAVEQRTLLISQFNAVAPRLVMSVLALPGAQKKLIYGDVHFMNDAEKNFLALIDITYSLPNALFHGSITPNETHNRIYKPAYLIVMRLVKCTI